MNLAAATPVASTSALPTGPSADSSRPRGLKRRTGPNGSSSVLKRDDGDSEMRDASAGPHKKKVRSTINRVSPLLRPASATSSNGDQPRSAGVRNGLPPRRGALSGASSTAPGARFARRVTSDALRGAIDVLREFLKKRYDPNAKLLNLDNMAQDPVFTENNIVPPGTKSQTRSSAAPAMWKLVKQHYPDTLSVSLANNQLSHLADLAIVAMIEALPNLENLSLKDNKISDIKMLAPLQGDASISKAGFGCLKELLLAGNPLREEAIAAGNMPTYTMEISKRFPTLSALDGLAIQPTEAPKPIVHASASTLGSGLKKPVAFPLPMKQGFSDESKDLVASFLARFFSLFDTNRQGLQHVYTPESTFSLTTNSRIPPRAKNTKSVQGLKNQHKLDWTPYFERSRSIQQSSKPTSTAELQCGSPNIITFLQALPKTSHPVAEPDKFVFDAWQQPNLTAGGSATLFISVQGQFSEASGGLRSFDRTWILIPSTPGSPAQMDGWPCSIVTEHWTIRGYSLPSAWSSDALAVRESSSPNKAQLSPEQQAVVGQLRAQTGLNEAFAFQCLTESGWSLEKAVHSFNAVKANIPAEAYQQ